ncbi:MAG: hypothetical protein SCM11_15060 [Bacillota bacterium]|nr:hypothetical protein [Bacillota bacterium]
MRITCSFATLKDISDLSTGETFIQILSKNDLIIDKAGAYEPVNKPFNAKEFPIIWQGYSINDNHTTGCFIFKGQVKKKFAGMVSWDKGLPENSIVTNSIYVTVSGIGKNDYDSIILLGDELFSWAKAEYGYITEYSREIMNFDTGNIFTCIDGLHWVNYFSKTYLNEPCFHATNDMYQLETGVRLKITDKPDDIRLSDSNFLNSIKQAIGIEWFWDKSKNTVLKRPKFDSSEIVKK